MKSIGLPDEIHEQLKKLTKATGMLQYRLIQEALDLLKEKYSEKILKYQEKNI